MKKLLIFLAAVLPLFTMGCGGTDTTETSPTHEEKPMLPGQSVYISHCKLCHGSKGDLGISGAANLKISLLSVDEIKNVVTNGRKAMPAWGKQLKPEEIQAVSEYVITLRQQ